MEGSLLSLTVAQFYDCARMILESACPEIESDGWHSAPGFGAYMFGTLSSILEMLRDKHSSLSLTLICYCHLVGMAKIVRGSTFVRP